MFAAITSCKKNTATLDVATVTTADISKVFVAGNTITKNELSVSASSLQAPSQGSGQTWNLSDIVYDGKTKTTTYTSTTSAFPAGALAWSGKVASLVSSDSIGETNVFDVSDSGLCQLGQILNASTITVPGLGTITYAAQADLNSKRMPETPMLPFQYGDSVTYSGVVNTENFVANAPAVGLSNTPGSQVFTSSGSAVAWASGKLTLKGFTAAMDVVVVKVHIKTITNYLLGGAPAPAALLAMLGLTDGAATYTDWYDFYNPGGVGFIGTIYVNGSNNITSAAFRAQ